MKFQLVEEYLCIMNNFNQGIVKKYAKTIG